MSAITQADNDELDAQLLAQNNVIDGLSLVISRQQAVMRQALEALSLALSDVDWRAGSPTQPVIHKAYQSLRNSLEGKQ